VPSVIGVFAFFWLGKIVRPIAYTDFYGETLIDRQHDSYANLRDDLILKSVIYKFFFDCHLVESRI
jgi:hypothetical protein